MWLLARRALEGWSLISGVVFELWLLEHDESIILRLSDFLSPEIPRLRLSKTRAIVLVIELVLWLSFFFNVFGLVKLLLAVLLFSFLERSSVVDFPFVLRLTLFSIKVLMQG